METQQQERLLRNIFHLSDDSGRYKPDVFRVSELVYCPAKSYWYRKADRRPTLNGKMLSGSMFHEKIPNILAGIVDNVKYEVPCQKDYTKYRICGHADAVSDDTVYEFKFSASNLKGQLPLNYYLQANAYATLLNKQHYSVILVHSFTLAVRELEGKTEPLAFAIIEQQAAEIYNALKTGIPPNGPFYTWECQYCDVRDLCKKDKAELMMENYQKELHEK